MMGEGTSKALVGVASGLAVSILGGMAGYVYRESFEAPRLTIQYSRVEAPDSPMALSEAAFRALKVDGNVIEFARERVTWDVRGVVRKNEYTYQQLGELRELLPVLLDRFKKFEDEERSKADVFGRALAKGTELLPDVSSSDARRKEVAASLIKEFPMLQRQLAAARNYYRSQWQTDIFEVFYGNPITALRKFIADSQGDLTQTQETIATISGISSEIDAKWKAGAPPKLPIVGNKVPELKVTVILANTGKTDALLRNTGTLHIAGTSAELLRYDEKLESRRRSFQFDKVSSGGVLEATYVLNTEKNTPEVEQKLYSDVIKGVKSMTISVVDVSGKLVSQEIDQ